MRPARSKLPVVDLGLEDESLPVHAHAAYFWETDKEFADAVGFLEVGLRGPDHCVIFGHEEANQAVCRILGERGFDVEALQANGRLSTLGGDASGETILHTIAATFERAIGGGAPLIRLLGNIGWRKHHWPDEEDLLAFEAKVTAATKQFPCVVVCMYDVAALPALIVRHGAFETHPFIVPRGPVRRNPYFVPTDLFLERLETIAREIAERRRAEEEIRLLETMTRTVSEAADLRSALLAVLRNVCETTGWALGQAWIPRADGSCLECRAWHSRSGDLEKFGKATEGLTLLPGNGLPGRAWLSKQPLGVQDLIGDTDFPLASQVQEAGIKAAMAFPVLAGDDVVAVIAFLLLGPHRANERLIRTIGTVATQLGMVIQHTRAEAASRQYSVQLERLVEERTAELRGSEERQRLLLEINNALISSLTREALFHAVAQALRRVVPFDRTAIFLHDPEKDVLKLFILESSLTSTYFTVGLEMAAGESHVGWVFQNRRPLLRRDLERERRYPMEDRALADGVRSYVIVPLMARGRSVGVLAVASTKTNLYSDSDVVLLQEIATQVALAVENMEAYEEIQQEMARRRRAEGLLRTLVEGTAAVTGEGFFNSLVRHLSSALEASYAFVTECVGKTRARTLAFWKRDSFAENFEFDVSDTPCRDVLLGDVKCYSGEVQALFPQDEDLQELGAESYLGIPVFDSAGQVVGHLAVLDDKPRVEDPGALAVLKVFAARAGAELKRLQAERELQAALGELERLKNRLHAENVYLQEEIGREHNFVEMVGSSPALLAVVQKIEQVAPTDSTVLISGETGTGKELVARAIHNRSARGERPLVKVNCSAISAGLVESELFGHVRGAFTGALERRVGRFELADRGTISLDEVGDLPLETQVKLLRVLQEREFELVGSSRPLKVDVRVIAATNRDLEEAVRVGRFRADLFYRLNVFPIAVPPLRERSADIPQLMMFFLAGFGKRFGKNVASVSEATMERLVRYPWPGNIRELQNVIERAVVLSSGPVLELDDDLLPVAARPAPGSGQPVPTLDGGGAAGLVTMEEVERAHIVAALEHSAWIVEGPKGAASVLGLHPNTLRSRMAKLGIKRPRHDRP